MRVLTVTFEGVVAARTYAAETRMPWPVVVDERRELYSAYGMRRAKFRHLLSYATMRTYVIEAVKGNWPRWPVADTVQQGGDVMIDPGGIVRLIHVGTGPADRPSVSEILKTCHSFLDG